MVTPVSISAMGQRERLATAVSALRRMEALSALSEPDMAPPVTGMTRFPSK
jgi:hypothetical protein